VQRLSAPGTPKRDGGGGGGYASGGASTLLLLNCASGLVLVDAPPLAYPPPPPPSRFGVPGESRSARIAVQLAWWDAARAASERSRYAETRRRWWWRVCAGAEGQTHHHRGRSRPESARQGEESAPPGGGALPVQIGALRPFPRSSRPLVMRARLPATSSRVSTPPFSPCCYPARVSRQRKVSPHTGSVFKVYCGRTLYNSPFPGGADRSPTPLSAIVTTTSHASPSAGNVVARVSRQRKVSPHTGSVFKVYCGRTLYLPSG
jgi:hypothetical protein